MQLKCNSCGAVQSLNESKKCQYCSNEIVIEKAVEYYENSSNSETGNMITMAESALEAGNALEAINYYNKSLEKGTSNSDAWLGKGIATVLSSTIADIKTSEAITYWKNAIKYASDPKSMNKRVAILINNTVIDFYPSIENHFIEFKDVSGAYTEFISKFLTLESALSFAVSINEDNLIIYDNGYDLCQKVFNVRNRSNNYDNKTYLDQKTKDILKSLDLAMIPEELFQIEKKYVNAINKLSPERALESFVDAKAKIDEEKAIIDQETKKVNDIKSKKAAKIASIGFFVGLIFGTLFAISTGNAFGKSILDGIFFGICFFILTAVITTGVLNNKYK